MFSGPDNSPKPAAYIVPRNAPTGTTINEAREMPGVIVIYDQELSDQQLAHFRARGSTPVILVAHEPVVKEVYVVKNLPICDMIQPIAPQHRRHVPKLSRHDLNPRKGRR